MSCDAELQELMVQVDRMVEERQCEWHDKIKNTEDKLKNSLQENYNLQSLLQDKNIQIENLKNNIKIKESIPNMTEYDQEVLQLRFELSQIRKSYEKYHYKFVKKSKEAEKEKEDLFIEKNELLKQINEYKSQQNQLLHENNKFQIEIKEIELRKNEAISDRTILSEQLNSLKENFAQQLETFTRSEQIYNNNIRELENKLQDSKKCLKREIEENRDKICDLMQHTKRTVEEKQQLMIDNESAKRMIIRLENELGKVVSDNKVKEKNIYKLEQVLKMSEKAINEKNDVIKAFQVNSSPKDYSSVISKLESELLEAKSNIKLTKKNEKTLQYEIITLDKKLKEAQQWIGNEQNNRKESEIKMNQMSKLEEDNVKLTKEIEKLEALLTDRSSEMKDIKSKLELLTLENIKLKQEEFQKKKNEETISDVKEASVRFDNNENNAVYKGTAQNMEKERNELLQFCQDKDMVIQRLQMENRILQEFITKLNDGFTGEISYAPLENHFNEFETVSDVFQPLKETFIEYNDNTMLGFNNKQTRSLSNGDSTRESMHPLLLKTSNSISVNSHYQSHHSANDNLQRSSEEFLSLLSQNDCSKRGSNPSNANYTSLYPTLTAAKYFTEERENTKHIEEIIDLHMAQLRLETDKTCGANNQL